MKSFVTLLAIGMGLWMLIQTLDTSTSVHASSGSGHSAPAGFVSSYSSALAQSKATGKPVVVVFSASWCPPCQQMKKDVYPSSEVMAHRSDFVWAYLDVDDEATREAAAKHSVRGIPHIQFLAPDGRDLGQMVGGCSPSQFADQLKQALSRAS